MNSKQSNTSQPSMTLPIPVLFSLGRLLATPAALAALHTARKIVAEYLTRHIQGDWGDLSDDDKAANDEAVLNGTRIVSCYFFDAEADDKLCIITEADRSATTVQLLCEY